MKLINIGFGNVISANRLVAIVSPDSAPIKRMVQDARDRGILIDASYGRRTRAVIIMDSDHIILSAVQRILVITHTVQRFLKITTSVSSSIQLDPEIHIFHADHFGHRLDEV